MASLVWAFRPRGRRQIAVRHVDQVAAQLEARGQVYEITRKRHPQPWGGRLRQRSVIAWTVVVSHRLVPRA